MVDSSHIRDDSKPTQQERGDIRQSQNNAGGYAFEVPIWERLERFLILGSEGGTYYVSEKDLTRRSTQAVKKCIETDGIRAVKRAAKISDEGRSHTNDPAIFVLAMALKLSENVEVRRTAAAEVPTICRIPTHLFRLAEFVDTFGGWGRLTRKVFAEWYNDSDQGRLAYHLIKYQQRGGWSHADLLRLSHPKPPTEAHNQLYGWVTNGWDEVPAELPEEEALHQVWAFEQVKRIYSQFVQGNKEGRLEVPLKELSDDFGDLSPSDRYETIPENALTETTREEANKPLADVWHEMTPTQRIIEVVQRYDLPRECIPGELKNNPEVWETLLDEGMPMHALRRNLAKMTSVGVLTPTSKYTQKVTDRLTNPEALKGSRTHPLDMLKASKTYSSGSGFRSDKTWEPVPQINDALNQGFRKAFDAVEPTEERILLALDVSGSMTISNCAGISQLTCCEASGALALLWANIEPRIEITGFTGTGDSTWGVRQETASVDAMDRLDISADRRLDEVLTYMRNIGFGPTDCSLPMRWGLDRDEEYDAIVILTDSETWVGDMHPHDALEEYREEMGIPTRLVVCAMEGNDFTIAKPDDPHSMDIVGFDTSTPRIVSEFILGNI